MSRFKRIKNTSTKKSSVSIDEKIAALNKELGKTGMLSEITNSTDGVYSTSTYVPPLPTIEADVPNSSGIGGEGFTQSSAGSGTEGDAPSYSSTGDLYNDGVDHPIYQTPAGDGLPASFGIVKYGGTGAATNYGIIEGGNIVRLVLGGYIAGGTRPAQHYVDIYIAYQHANIDNPGTYTPEQIEEKRVAAQLARQVENIRDKGLEAGYEFNVPWQGYRSPQFMESMDGRTTFIHPEKGLQVLSGFTLLGFPNRYIAQDARPPGSTNPLRRGTEDEPIYPGPIPPGMDPELSDPAYEELRRRAERRRKEEERRRKEEERRRREEEERRREEEEEGELVYGMTQEEVERKFGHLDDDGLARRGIIRNPDGSYREMTEQEQKAYRQKQLDKAALVVARAAGVSVKTIQWVWSNGTVAGNVTKTIDSFLKGDTGFDFLDNLSDKMSKPILKFIGKKAGVPTPSNFLLRYDKWLASGARGSVDMTRYIDPRSARALTKAANNFGSLGMKGFYKAQLKQNGGNEKQALETLAMFVERNVDQVTNADSPNKNLKMSIGNGIRLDKKAFIASKGKVIRFSKGYKFAEGVGSVAGADKTMLGQFARGLGVELDTFGDGSYMVPAILGAKYGLQTVNRQYKGSPDAAPVMPYSFTVKSPFSGDINESYWKTYEWIDLSQVKNDEQVSLQEGVGLGLYEPVAMNVDLADIRKGVMPEYPKKPPAEMIDGYHKDSKLKPKKFKDKYLLKIDEKDLIRNHRLKKGEADEMINTVKMINDYLKDHPADLIYVQQRYPVDDKRLAVLNWKMDQMLQAGKEYLDSNFKENQTLFKRAKERTKRNTALTNPDYIQKHYDELRGTIKPESKRAINRKSPSRFFKKPKKKSSMEEINDKIKQLDKDLLI